MFLSRSGLELGEIWAQQEAALVEADERLRHRQRAAASGDPQEQARYIRELRRAGKHDEADAHALAPHVKRFVDASTALHKHDKRAHDHLEGPEAAFNQQHYTHQESSREQLHKKMKEAREALHHRTANALREHGKLSPLHKAKGVAARYEVGLAHGAKHLPPTDDFDHERALLSDYHEMHGHSHHEPSPTSAHIYRAESAAQRHGFVHSLVTRNPELHVMHGYNPHGPRTGRHFVHILVGSDRKPLRSKSGRVTEARPDRLNQSHSTADYLASHPPHADKD